MRQSIRSPHDVCYLCHLVPVSGDGSEEKRVMAIQKIIQEAEGRRLEFKEVLPEKTDWVHTIIAFANDAGGELYIGVRDDPREITGLPEEHLMGIEQRVSNVIYDRCCPVIMPDITFLADENKHIIRVTVHRGNTPPYYLKDKGKQEGTYIRIGSTNRLADEAILNELERRKRNVSFDSEPVMDKVASCVNIESFKQVYQDKTGEPLDIQALRKQDLVKMIYGKEYPTNALILFSDDELRQSIFPFAKVECARFRGTNFEEFIDQKTVFTNISTQAEEAYNFVLRHINKSAEVKGVYTVSRWEYPVKAIREVIRNAIVHRDYSLPGKDIKVAIYDDMVEVTSPGLLPPSIDYASMESRQSDARNRVIAPVFKRMGIIDQWGNGLKLIADELKEYPHVQFRWEEKGLAFQVQFAKCGPWLQQDLLTSQQELQQELPPSQQDLPTLQQELLNPSMYSDVLNRMIKTPLSRKEISEAFGQKRISGQLNKTLSKLLEDTLIEYTIPENKNHPEQKLSLTKQGRIFLELLKSR